MNDEDLVRRTAAALRNSCDRLFNEGGTLELSAGTLRILHSNFSAISPTSISGNGAGEFEAVCGPSCVESASLLDLQFLYDVVQLTRRLCVTADGCDVASDVGTERLTDSGTSSAGDSLSPAEVPLAAFRSLERLRLQAVPVHLVRGLQARRPYLRALVCAGCSVTSLAEVLANCGGDGSSPFLWEELTEVVVTRCRLDGVDVSLKLTPHLTRLDLSHNQLVVAERLEYLSVLQELNLEANQLVKVPALSVPASLGLRRLCLRSNRLENLNGLEELAGLEQLDISYNFLLSHAALTPLAPLRRLRTLLLTGNPLCCFRDHRRRTTQLIHQNCQHEQFVLDGRQLGRAELPERRDPPPARTVRRPAPLPSPSLVRARSQQATGSSSSTPRTRRRRSARKRSRVNLADISDMDAAADGAAPQKASRSPAEVARELTSSFDSSQGPAPHRVTREQIEALRQQLGADWLHSRGGTMVQRLLGLPEQAPPTFIVGSLADSDSVGRVNGSGGTSRASPAVGSPGRRSPPLPTRSATAPAPLAAIAQAEDGRSPDEPSLYPKRDGSELSWERESSDELDDDEVCCLVVARRIFPSGLEEDVMITVTDSALKEKELDAARTVAEWDLQTVEACHVTKMEPLTVQLNFDTVRREKRERNYYMEQSEWEELSAVLQPRIEARLASELAANALQCMKCAAEFSDGLARTAAASTKGDKRTGQYRHVPVCPNCGSNMIIRAEKVSHPNAEVALSADKLATALAKKPPLKKRLSSKKVVASTPRHMMQTKQQNAEGREPAARDLAAVADDASPQATAATSVLTTRAEVHADSPEKTPESSESERGSSRGPPPDCAGRPKPDSDIEVISNPSESSIEVIIDTTLQSDKKAELKAEDKEAVNDSAACDSARPMETSSSSGSMSASVCTVWEQQQQRALVRPEPRRGLTQTPLSPAATDLSSTLTAESALSPQSPLSPPADASAIYSPRAVVSAVYSPESDTSAAMRENCGTECEDSVDNSRDGEGNDCVVQSWLKDGDSESVEDVGDLRFWHDDLSRADHRLQLHLEMNVFADNERLVFVAKVACALDPHYAEFDAVLVLSSHNLSVFELLPDESDQLERCLRLRLCRPLPEVTCLGALLHGQGVGLQVTGRDPALSTQLLLLTGDSGRGHTLLRRLRECCTCAGDSVRWRRAQESQVELMLSGDSGADLRLRQLLFPQLISEQHEAAPAMLCMTSTDLLLMERQLRWLVPGHGDVKIPMRDREHVANVVGVELVRAAVSGRPAVRLLFRDAGSGAEHAWLLTATTRGSLAALVAALQLPWARQPGDAAPPQTLCDVYRTEDGHVLHLGPLSPDLAGWVKVTSVLRPSD